MTALGALVGAQGFIGSMIGFEPATRAMRLIMHDQLNDEIDAQAERWLAADLELQAMGFDPGVGQVEVEHVEDANLLEGPHQSYLISPPTAFPMVCVMAYLTRPSATSGFGDQVDSSQITLAIDAFVKSGPVAQGVEAAHETIVHRRIQRTTEAINAVMRRNPALMGAVAPVPSPPLGGIDQAMWLRRDADGPDRYMLQGSRLEYQAQRAASY